MKGYAEGGQLGSTSAASRTRSLALQQMPHWELCQCVLPQDLPSATWAAGPSCKRRRAPCLLAPQVSSIKLCLPGAGDPEP